MKKQLAILTALTSIMAMAASCSLTTSTSSSETAAPAASGEEASQTAAESVTGEKLTGKAEGYGGELVVEVVRDGNTIKAVTIVSNSETKDIGSNAVDQLPAAIVKANSVEVDDVSGATVSSTAIKAAVNNALDPVKYPYTPAAEKETAPATPAVIEGADAYIGVGINSTGRIGPGKDDTETPVYSFNQVFAQAAFDKDGKITLLNIDQLEVATPNYDGAGMPHFSGFPGQGGYNLWDDAAQKVNGKTEDTEETFQSEISAWKTKRQRGADYKMGIGTWASQMDKYEETFVGMTVDEVDAWFEKYCSDANGRPLTEKSNKEGDEAKYGKLTDDEKTMLADVTTGATMSLKDGHGDILSAIRAAYDARVPVNLENVAKLGFGLNTTGRIGPGKDDTETPVYSINEVVATTLMDKDGKIIQLLVDQVEVATPNYDGAGMPHFSGFPGQGGYNLWDDAAQKVNGKSTDSEDAFMGEFSTWTTKRQRGEDYKMGIGTWASQMDKYEETFVGMTADEVSQWFAKYCSDANGRPLTEKSNKEGDEAKYGKLTDDEKTMLADVTTTATMSLNDGHGNIVAAITDSAKNVVEITVQ